MIIDSNTALYSVLGDPVGHSLSPVMHNRAFSCVGYNGVYLAFQVKDVAGAVTGIRALNIQGASITIPHKVAITAFLDKVDRIAARIGAINTVMNRDGFLSGYNTDALGAVRALSEKTPLNDKSVTIIGAGGAARAIGFGVISEGSRVTILNRTTEKGERLAQALGADFQPLLKNTKLTCDILINTTPLGMIPNTDMLPVPQHAIEKEMIVMDIVYNPLETKLLREAEKIGCVTIDGTAMFVYQGALQFELWTGLPAPVDIMKQTVMEILNQRSKAGNKG